MRKWPCPPRSQEMQRPAEVPAGRLASHSDLPTSHGLRRRHHRSVVAPVLRGRKRTRQRQRTATRLNRRRNRPAGSEQIVDRFHVKQNLSDVAKVLNSNSSQATAWAKLRHHELDAGTLSAILESLRPHLDTCEEARKCYHYIRRNRHRMRYLRFLKMGFCTSSGVVEAGCKVTVATRLKRAGMHWTVDGANQIIALRCCILSGRFEDFWERRSSMPIAA